MARLIIGLVLVAHGIGHSLGILQMLRIATVDPDWDGRSWLLTGFAGPSVTEIVGIALWSVAMIGFVALGGVVIGWLPGAWWVPLAVISAVASLAGLALFPIALPMTSTVGALVVDLVVLTGMLWFHWVPSDLPA